MGWVRRIDVNMPDFPGSVDKGIFEDPVRQLRVLLSIDEGKWHMSISHPTRFPNWNEIKRARYFFMPDEITVAMLLPPKDDFVNIHENCFHLWEIDDPEREHL